MTLTQIYNVAVQTGLQHLQVHLGEDFSGDTSAVTKVEVGFFDSNEGIAYNSEEAAENIADSADYAGLNYVQYENRYVTKVLLLS
jgi:hypothetical protein